MRRIPADANQLLEGRLGVLFVGDDPVAQDAPITQDQELVEWRGAVVPRHSDVDGFHGKPPVQDVEGARAAFRVARIPTVRQVAMIAGVLAMAGCATIRTDVTPYRTADSAVAVDSVEVISQEVRADHEELGLIEVRAVTTTVTYGELILRARQEAAALGADAVVISRDPIHGAVATPVYGSVIASQTERARVWAVAIRWKP